MLSFGVVVAGVVVACVLALLLPGGGSDAVEGSRSAWGFGFDFLRGPIPASVVKIACTR